MTTDGAQRGGFLAAGGSVVAAAIASACCWLPLALILVGASGVGVSAFFEQFRPWFLGISALLLGAGFYFNYFRRERCEEGAACATPNRKLQRTSRVMLWVAMVGVLAFAFFPNYVGALLGGTANADTEGTIVLDVGGMTCGGCALTVEQALLRVPGVASAQVSYEEARAVVTLDPESGVSADALVEAVENTGFEAAVDASETGSN